MLKLSLYFCIFIVNKVSEMLQYINYGHASNIPFLFSLSKYPFKDKMVPIIFYL